MAPPQQTYRDGRQQTGSALLWGETWVPTFPRSLEGYQHPETQAAGLCPVETMATQCSDPRSSASKCGRASSLWALPWELLLKVS